MHACMHRAAPTTDLGKSRRPGGPEVNGERSDPVNPGPNQAVDFSPDRRRGGGRKFHAHAEYVI